jgi:hypothetical protein
MQPWIADEMTAPATGSCQLEAWPRQFRREYTNRNPQGPREMNELYVRQYVSRDVLNTEFVNDLNRDSYILEVGIDIIQGNALDYPSIIKRSIS